jgi:ABC-type molybdate transport system substrate-binding protein
VTTAIQSRNPGVRVGVSPPKVGPLGDDAVRLFGLADHLRPASAAALQSCAVVLDAPPGAPPPKSGDTDAEAILGGRVDASIVYCSGWDRYARLLPDATHVPFPPAFQIGPEYGLAF